MTRNSRDTSHTSCPVVEAPGCCRAPALPNPSVGDGAARVHGARHCPGGLLAPSPLPLAGPREAQCWLIAASRNPGQHSADMSKAFHLTAGLGCSCLQHSALEAWEWLHMGRAQQRQPDHILLGKVPSLVTGESKGFCDTLVLQALVKDQTGLSRGSPGEEAGPSLALKLLSASSLQASPSRLCPRKAPLHRSCTLLPLLWWSQPSPCQGEAVRLCFIIIRPRSGWRKMKRAIFEPTVFGCWGVLFFPVQV